MYNSFETLLMADVDNLQNASETIVPTFQKPYFCL